MLQILGSGAPNILRVRVTGQLTAADHASFLARLESLVHRYGKVRVLFDMSDLENCDPCSAWNDPVRILRWKDAVIRFAVLGKDAQGWEKRLAEPFINARFFPLDQREDAWHWVAEGAEDEIDREWLRHLAYAKWEAAGRPTGDGLQFWKEAERELLHLG